MLGSLGSLAMGQGSSISGGDSGPATATGHSSNDISTGVGGIGGFNVGDYYSRGAQVSKPQNNTLLIAGVVVVVAFLWLRKK